MTKYAIVAATPKNSESHLNSKFKTYEQNDFGSWDLVGWQTIYDISDLIRYGHTVLTGKISEIIENGQRELVLEQGASVEMVLRISRDNKNYKISEMPDK